MVHPPLLRDSVADCAPTRVPWTNTVKSAVPVPSAGAWAAALPVAVRHNNAATLRWRKDAPLNGMTDEYHTIKTGAGWIDRTARGRVLLEGADGISFLQALVSNDVARLASGQGAYATYLTPQGRMIADLEAYIRPGGVLLDVTDGVAEALATRLDLSVFSEDVRVSDVSARLTELLVIGAGAAVSLANAFGVDSVSLEGLHELSQIEVEGGFIARAAESRLPSFKIIARADAHESLVNRLERAGIIHLSETLVAALRVEAGRPLFGVDLSTDTIPLEAGLLDRAISTSKGCYVGQEIIIRILHRGGGRVARRLALLDITGAGVPASGTILRRDDRDVGQLTSVSQSPDGASVIALGFVARDSADLGRELRVAGVESGIARVTGFAG